MTSPDAHNSHSLYNTSKWIMAAIIVVAMTAMAISILTLVQSRSDAAAINVSGSLRMQNYRLAYAIESGAPQAEIEQKVVALQTSLNDPSLSVLAERSAPKALREKYQAILDEWHQLKPQLLDRQQHQDYLQSVTAFVGRIDRLVYLIQLNLEDKVVKLALFEAACLLCLGLLAFFTMQFVRRRVVLPLNALIDAAQRVQQREFDVKLPISKHDELGVLAEAFQQMAAELAQRYQVLQRTVEKRNHELKQANDSLSVLYQCSETVHSHHIDEDTLTSLLNRFGAHLELHYLSIQLAPDLEFSLPSEIEVGQRQEDGVVYRKPLAIAPIHFGTLILQSTTELEQAEQQLLDSFCRLLCRVFHVQSLQHREQTLLLLEERSIIARELHDSLAQSLSYLKIQLTRLNHSLKENPVDLGAREVIDEIDSGISNAYQQLRELLSTFRLTVKENSLEEALEKMLNELQPRSKPKLSLSYHLHRQVVRPQQFIHILQIAREATLNAIKHADATGVTISCRHQEQQIRVSIEDDGCGIAELAHKPNHFGLGIMKERAALLNGNVTFEKTTAGGTLVSLTFPET